MVLIGFTCPAMTVVTVIKIGFYRRETPHITKVHWYCRVQIRLFYKCTVRIGVGRLYNQTLLRLPHAAIRGKSNATLLALRRRFNIIAPSALRQRF